MLRSAAVAPIRARVREALDWLRWDDLGARRRAVVSGGAYVTAVALSCTLALLAGTNYSNALIFAGLTLGLATVAAAVHLTSVTLRRRAPLLTYGVAALGSTSAFVIVAFAARSGSDVVTALGVLPPLVGSWLAVMWVSDLANRGLSGVDFIQATTTIRGTAALWLGFIALVAIEAATTGAGFDLPIAELGEGLANIVSLAAIFTYAGPGWSEYKRGRAKTQDGLTTTPAA